MTIEEFKQQMNMILDDINRIGKDNDLLTLSDDEYQALLEDLGGSPYAFIVFDSNDDTKEITGSISIRSEFYDNTYKDSPLIIGNTFNSYLAFAMVNDVFLTQLSDGMYLLIEPLYGGKPIDETKSLKRSSKTLDDIYKRACDLEIEMNKIISKYYR